MHAHTAPPQRRSRGAWPWLAGAFTAALIALVVAQVTLGVLNVKLALPLAVAVMHNGGAVALLFVLVSLLARLRAPE